MIPDDDEATLMTVAEYAAHRRCSRPAVYKAITTGRIKEALVFDGERTLVDAEMADYLWERRTRPSMSPMMTRPATAGRSTR